MTNEMIALVVTGVLVVAAFWVPLFMLLLYTRNALGRLDLLAGQGKQAHARLDALVAALASAEQANEARGRQLVAELRGTRDTAHGAAAEATRVGRELVQVVRDADGSFRHLADSLKDLDTLQQMSGHVQRFSVEMASASGKIESQLGTAGKVLEALHGVVDAWSRERAPLEAQHDALAREVEKSLSFERAEREELRRQLSALMLKLNTEVSGARA